MVAALHGLRRPQVWHQLGGRPGLVDAEGVAVDTEHEHVLVSSLAIAGRRLLLSCPKVVGRRLMAEQPFFLVASHGFP